MTMPTEPENPNGDPEIRTRREDALLKLGAEHGFELGEMDFHGMLCHLELWFQTSRQNYQENLFDGSPAPSNLASSELSSEERLRFYEVLSVIRTIAGDNLSDKDRNFLESKLRKYKQ